MERRIHDENISKELLGNEALNADARINTVIQPYTSFKDDEGADLISRHGHGSGHHIINDMVPLHLIHDPGRNVELPPADLLQRPAKLRLEHHRQSHDEHRHQLVQNPADHMKLQPSCNHRKNAQKHQPLQKSCGPGVANQNINTV